MSYQISHSYHKSSFLSSRPLNPTCYACEIVSDLSIWNGASDIVETIYIYSPNKVKKKTWYIVHT